jgi:hypothetical protein
MPDASKTDDIADPGPRPEMAWLPLVQLTVEQRYQRSTTGKRSAKVIARIAGEFSWAKFQPPTVAAVGESTYAIIDGQHRVAAALKHPAIEEVPCYIVATPEIREQADAFVAINRDRVTVTPFAQHHAEVEAAAPLALAVAAACREAGVTIPRTVRQAGSWPLTETPAPGTIAKAVSRHGPELVTRALVILRRVAEARGEQTLVGNAINGLVLLLAKLGEHELDDERMIRQLVASTGVLQLQKTARAYKGNFGGSMAEVMRLTFVKLYNRNLRADNQLPEQLR